jgi:hypothetical protein
MQFFGAVIIFLLVFFAICALIGFMYIRRFFIRIRQHMTGDYDEETFRRMSDKYYQSGSGGASFEEDYFKGSGTNKKGAGFSKPRQSQSKQQTTTTKEGVTIIDERTHADKKKIFQDNEGEYVDFVEE